MNQKLQCLPWHSNGWILCCSAIEMGMRGSLYSWGGVRETWHRWVMASNLSQLQLKKCHAEVGLFSSATGYIDSEASKLVKTIQVSLEFVKMAATYGRGE